MNDKVARDWYEKQALEQTWSVQTLQRNISSQYYYRILQTQKKEFVEQEMKELTSPYQNDKLEFIKMPTEEELRAEIETQKAMFYLQQKEKEDME